MNLDNYVDKIIAKAEGTTAHTGQEGAATAAYGLTAAATQGRPKKENESDREYAKRVINDKYVAEVKKKLGNDVWDNLPEGMKVVAVDVHYNAGLGGNPSFVKSLKDGDYPQALKNTLDIVGVTQNGARKISSGLAKRRASIYNIGAQDIGVPKISDTLATRTNGDTNSQISYFTGDGKDVLFTLDTTNPLASDSSEGWKAPTEYNYPRAAGAGRGYVNPEFNAPAGYNTISNGAMPVAYDEVPQPVPQAQPTYDYIPQQPVPYTPSAPMSDFEQPRYATMEDLLADRGLMGTRGL